MRRILWIVAALATMPGPIWAQNFTTAAEIKPILEATRSSWVAVREFDGRDLVYFTHLMAWRCGITEIRYGLNGAAAETLLPMEPCYEAEAVPNALKSDSGVEIYLSEALGSVQSVAVRLLMDDGSELVADYPRAAVLMP